MPPVRNAASFVAVGKGLIAVHDWTFLLGPNFVCAIDTLVLAYLMWRSRLIPRFIVGLGLVGGPLLFASATAVLFGAYQQVSLPGAVAPLPVFAWELTLAFFLIVKGPRTTPPRPARGAASQRGRRPRRRLTQVRELPAASPVRRPCRAGTRHPPMPSVVRVTWLVRWRRAGSASGVRKSCPRSAH